MSDHRVWGQPIIVIACCAVQQQLGRPRRQPSRRAADGCRSSKRLASHSYFLATSTASSADLDGLTYLGRCGGSASV